MQKQGAKLVGWHIEGLVAIGHVYGHPNFLDGAYIHTSRIVRINKKAGIIKTLHTYYRLEGYEFESEKSNEISELERQISGSVPDVPEGTRPLRE